MKKITLLAAVVIAASFASCKKNYTCACTWSDGTSAGSYTYKNTKKKATDACTANNVSGLIDCKIN